MKKNILFVAHDTLLYGANQSLINMVSSINGSNEISLRIVVPDRGLICSQFDLMGIDYDVVRYKSELCTKGIGIKSKFFTFLKYINKSIVNSIALIKLSKIVKKYKINIVHSNSSIITIGEKLAFKESITHVWHLREYIDLDHGLDVFGGLNKYKRRVQKSKNIICISQGIAKHFGVQNRALVLYNAVRKDPAKEDIKLKHNYFLFCGSLVKNKGIEEAIQAFYSVLKFKKDLRLVIAGTGGAEYENYLKQLVFKLDLQNSVDFLGFRKDTDILMSNAQALLMCSLSEALGRVTIEAMLNYCLVIGFNNAGTTELVRDGETGFLYNNLEELVMKMNTVLINEKEYIDSIRLNAYNFASNNFLEKQFGNKLIAQYNFYLDKHNS